MSEPTDGYDDAMAGVNEYHGCDGKAKDYNTLNLRPKVRVEILRACENPGTYAIGDKWYCWRHKDGGSRDD